MKLLLLLIPVLIITGCGCTKEEIKSENPTLYIYPSNADITLNTDDFDKWIAINKIGDNIILSTKDFTLQPINKKDFIQIIK